jgi:hypothetical protein
VRTTATAFSYDAANNVLTVTATQARYADIAERYIADKKYLPGTVLIFGGNNEVTASTLYGDKRVAGVVTTNPAYLMNSQLEHETSVDIALQGRVPTLVLGPVGKGDLIVSAPNGHATVDNEAKAGTIIGKSLENFDATENESIKLIEVVIGKH